MLPDNKENLQKKENNLSELKGLLSAADRFTEREKAKRRLNNDEYRREVSDKRRDIYRPKDRGLPHPGEILRIPRRIHRNLFI
jgi:hypothetical protein